MNPAYGSWIAFRAVIVLDLPADLGPDPPLREPCPLTPVEKEAARGDDDNALERAQVFAAACAGTAAAVAATPIETIKVALQTWPGSTLRSVVPRIAARGTRGFFTGLDAMLIANVPYSLVFYGCYQPIRDGVNR